MGHPPEAGRLHGWDPHRDLQVVSGPLHNISQPLNRHVKRWQVPETWSLWLLRGFCPQGWSPEPENYKDLPVRGPDGGRSHTQSPYLQVDLLRSHNITGEGASLHTLILPLSEVTQMFAPPQACSPRVGGSLAPLSPASSSSSAKTVASGPPSKSCLLTASPEPRSVRSPWDAALPL